jgi:hypothetical protein
MSLEIAAPRSLLTWQLEAGDHSFVAARRHRTFRVARSHPSNSPLRVGHDIGEPFGRNGEPDWRVRGVRPSTPKDPSIAPNLPKASFYQSQDLHPRRRPFAYVRRAGLTRLAAKPQPRVTGVPTTYERPPGLSDHTGKTQAYLLCPGGQGGSGGWGGGWHAG